MSTPRVRITKIIPKEYLSSVWVVKKSSSIDFYLKYANKVMSKYKHFITINNI